MTNKTIAAGKPLGDVLGTPVFAALDDERPDLFLISDLHVPEGGEGVDGAAESRVLRGLTRVLEAAEARAATARVWILGDLFESFVSWKQSRVGVWRVVAERLAHTVDAGVPVTILHGNRDFMLDERWGRATGARVLPGGGLLRFGERTLLVLHGDELCVNDLPYQKAKRWLRSPVTKAMLRRLPLAASMRLARKARSKSVQSIATGDQARFAPPHHALQSAFSAVLAADGSSASARPDTLVFGHVHQASRTPWPGAKGAEALVLPAFDEAWQVLVAGAGGAHDRLVFTQVDPESGAMVALADPDPRLYA